MYIPYLLYNFIKSDETVFSLRWVLRYTPIRRSVFIPQLATRSLLVHTGNTYIQQRISPKYKYIKIGQMFFTKSTPIHYSQTKQKKKMRQERRMRRKHKK
jgi:ribosomal protein S19